MKFYSLVLGFVLAVAAVQARADEAEVRKYCEDAAKLMQVQGAKRDAYIASCIEERTKQLKEEK